MERISFLGRTDAQSPLKNELFFNQAGELEFLPWNSTFDDIDDDGDLDAFIGGKTNISGNTGYSIKHFRNTGNSVNPQFTEVADAENPFLAPELQNYWQTLELGDIDGDEDLDAFIGYKDDSTSGIVYVKNTGDKTTPQFTPAEETGNPLAQDPNNPVEPIYIELADIDGDEDLDAFIGNKDTQEGTGNTLFFQNTGDKNNPQFTQVTGADNPFENVLSLDLQFADIDNDTDLDAFIGTKDAEGSYPVNLFYENTGNNTDPQFIERTGSDYPLENLRYAPYPTLTDIDGDGDLDAFSLNWVNLYSGVSTEEVFLKYFENKPGIYVTPVAPTVLEGAEQEVVFDVTVIGATNPVTVEVHTQNDSAIAGEDYTEKTTQTLSFPTNGTQQITIPIIDSNTNEPDQTFKLILENSTNAEINNPETVITITDTQEVTTTTTLAAQVENLTLKEEGAHINGTGNSNANILTGNSGNNSLNGMAGNDTLIGNNGNDTLNGWTGNDNMSGGKGNDTYYVQATLDVVTEDPNSGTDKVISSVTRTLEDNVENLTLNGSSPVNGTGNKLNNVMVGNSQNNTLTGLGGNDNLNGGVGADTLVGGKGNDIYTVDNSGDVVEELANEGNDRVVSFVNYTLPETLEHLTLGGNDPLTATGNSNDNLIIGNSGDNLLTGGTGADTFHFVAPSHGVDTISDFSGSDGEGDIIRVNATNFGLVRGSLTDDQFVLGTAATEAAHRFIYNDTNGQLFYDADGSGTDSQLHLATLTGSPELAANDIFIF